MDRAPSVHDSVRDAYEVLEVRVDASQVVIQAAFRALAALYHPDAWSEQRIAGPCMTAFAGPLNRRRRPWSSRRHLGQRPAREYSTSAATTAGASRTSRGMTPITCCGYAVIPPASGTGRKLTQCYRRHSIGHRTVGSRGTAELVSPCLIKVGAVIADGSLRLAAIPPELK